MDFQESAKNYPGTAFWDFHRSNLHMCLYDRAIQLGATVLVNSRLESIRVDETNSTATAMLSNGTQRTADLIIGADGIFSTMRDILAGRPDPPIPTGDLAYRLLLSTTNMMNDPELAPFVTDPQVNYWLGPDKHAGEPLVNSKECY